LLVINEQELPEGIRTPHLLSFVISFDKFCLRTSVIFTISGEICKVSQDIV